MPTAFATRLALAALLMTGLALAGCGKKESTAVAPPAKETADKAASAAPAAPAAPTDREIKIVAIKPDIATLKVGETARLTISGTYVLPAAGGSVGVVVQDAKNALVANKLTAVAGGSGTFTEEIEFKVPATDHVMVNVPLYLKDGKVSVTVASKEIKVAAK